MRIKTRAKSRRGRPAAVKTKRGFIPDTTLPFDQIDTVLRNILTTSLALYILSTSRIPLSKVVSALTEMEKEAAKLAGGMMLTDTRDARISAIKGTLANALSFVHIHINRREASTSKKRRG